MSSDNKFSKPPSGSALSESEMKKLVNGDDQTAEKATPTIDEVAKVLGGTVKDTPEEGEAEEKVKTEPEVDGVPVDKEDQKEYIRTMLASEPFTKKYELFGGNLVVIFRTRNTKENDQVDIVIRNREYEELVKAKSYAIVRERLRLVTSCQSMTIGGGVCFVDMDYLNSMNETTFAAVRKAFRHFEATCDVMFERANDSDFWKGTDGAT
jgi:predicted acyl esterase